MKRFSLVGLLATLLLSACGTAPELAKPAELAPQAATGTTVNTGAYTGPYNLRSGPGTNYSIVGSVGGGVQVSIVCHANGTSHTGPYGTTNLWDKLSTGRWISDAFVYTGSNSAVAPACSGTTPPSNVIGDNYPYKNYSMEGVDPWKFYYRQCTSFAAWRVVKTKNGGFHNYYGGVRWGNAHNWDNAARAVGVPVYSTPRVGDIAVWEGNQSGASYLGHVAYVARVNGDGTVLIEEYNWATMGGYGTRTISASSVSSYIRF